MNKEQWQIYHKLTNLLTTLAQRNNEKIGYWYHHITDPKSGDLLCVCNICGALLVSNSSVVRPHGMEHLKDKNLLPFI